MDLSYVVWIIVYVAVYNNFENGNGSDGERECVCVREREESEESLHCTYM